MEQNQVSLTAQMTAFARAYHSLNESPKIFNDFLARDLFTDEQYAFFKQSVAQLLPMVDPEATDPDPDQAVARVVHALMTSTLTRSRFAEDRLLEAVEQGVRQYVILGAGLDTFAFRNPELLKKGLHVYEVDHPATQQFKREQLDTLSWDLPTELHFVPVDFATDDLAAALSRASYDPNTPTFFSWLGVTLYLPREAVLGTLETIADLAPEGSQVVFDYLDTDAFVSGKSARSAQLRQQITERIGEPLKAGFDPVALESLLEQVGLALQEDLSPDEIEQRYFAGRTDGCHAEEHFHFARAVVVGG